MRTSSRRMTWPDYFPPGCPPADAGHPAGVVYRFVRKNPPADSDFVCNFLEQPGRSFGDQMCEGCGMSVYTDRQDAEAAWRQVPGMRKRHIAEGSLDGTAGKFKPTPRLANPSHCTWWAAPGSDCRVRFTIVVHSSPERR